MVSLATHRHTVKGRPAFGRSADPAPRSGRFREQSVLVLADVLVVPDEVDAGEPLIVAVTTIGVAVAGIVVRQAFQRCEPGPVGRARDARRPKDGEGVPRMPDVDVTVNHARALAP